MALIEAWIYMFYIYIYICIHNLIFYSHHVCIHIFWNDSHMFYHLAPSSHLLTHDIIDREWEDLTQTNSFPLWGNFLSQPNNKVACFKLLSVGLNQLFSSLPSLPPFPLTCQVFNIVSHYLVGKQSKEESFQNLMFLSALLIVDEENFINFE